ncbi:MAG: S9 family peptidase [Proteobacteria bacterium]|nr:S9 family peptidase [Pseudomonadota bacterium]
MAFANRVGFLLPCGFGLLFASLALRASELTLAQVHDYAYPSGLTAADKAAVAAWINNDHGVRNIWVASDNGANVRQLTTYSEDDGQEISGLTVAADGSRLVYVRGGDHGANWDWSLPSNTSSNPEGAKVEVWSVSTRGGAPVSLGEGDFPALSPDGKRTILIRDKAPWIVPTDGGEAKRLLSVHGEIDSVRWSPDGTHVAFVAHRDDHSFIGIYSDEHHPIVWVAPSVAFDEAPRWSPDSKRIAFTRRPGSGGPPIPLMKYERQPWEIWTVEASGGTGTRLWSSGSQQRDSYTGGFFEWMGKDRIVFQSYRDGWQHLYSLPVSGATEPLLLTPGHFMVEDVAMAPSRDYVVYNANAGTDADDVDRRHLFRVNVDEAKPKPLTSGKSLEWSPVVMSDQQVILVSATAQRPPLPGLLATNGSVRLLAQLHPHYPAEQLVIPTRSTFRSQDGLEVHGQLFMPGSHKRNGAAIVFVHGGPERQMYLGWHSMEYYSNDYALNQYLASRGFVVLALNYRLGIGYGFDYNYPEAAGPRGASEYQDVVAAAGYLSGLQGVDSKRVGIFGGSYGGYLTAMALAHNSDRFSVGVDFAGVHDWTADYDVKELLTRKRYEVAPDLQQLLDTAWRSSPVSSIGTWRSPVLLIHGDDDRNVHVLQTIDLAKRLSATPVPYELLILPDEQHGLARYASIEKVDAAEMAFLERHLARQGGAK